MIDRYRWSSASRGRINQNDIRQRHRFAGNRSSFASPRRCHFFALNAGLFRAQRQHRAKLRRDSVCPLQVKRNIVRLAKDRPKLALDLLHEILRFLSVIDQDPPIADPPFLFWGASAPKESGDNEAVTCRSIFLRIGSSTDSSSNSLPRRRHCRRSNTLGRPGPIRPPSRGCVPAPRESSRMPGAGC